MKKGTKKKKMYLPSELPVASINRELQEFARESPQAIALTHESCAFRNPANSTLIEIVPLETQVLQNETSPDLVPIARIVHFIGDSKFFRRGNEGDHATTREERIAWREAYCSGVIRRKEPELASSDLSPFESLFLGNFLAFVTPASDSAFA